jgi:hypothetical protein
MLRARDACADPIFLSDTTEGFCAFVPHGARILALGRRKSFYFQSTNAIQAVLPADGRRRRLIHILSPGINIAL